MRFPSAAMPVGRWSLALWMVMVTAFTPMAPAARAQVVTDVLDAPATATDSMSDDPPAEMERWWGVLGGILCATEWRLARLAPAIGMNPYAIAAGLGGCLLAAIDVFTST